MVRRLRNEESILQRHGGLIRKLALKFWRQLPVSVKMWVDLDDLIIEGQIYVLHQMREHYDRFQARESTFLWVALSNMYLNFALRYQVKKRAGWMVPLEDVTWMLGTQDAVIAQREALDALAKTYKQASKECRAEIIRWFGQEPVRAGRSARALNVYEEFRQLAQRNGLSKEDCRNLMRSGVCLWHP